MKELKHPFSLKLTKILVGIFLLLLITHLTLQYINTVHLDSTYGPFYELTNRFDFDDEMSIPTWYAQFLFLLVAGSCLLVAFIEKRKATRFFWLLLVAVSLAGSIDEVSAIHESVLQALHLSFFDTNSPTLLANAWILVAPIVIILLFIFLYKIARLLPKKTVVLITTSACIYITGAVLVDIASSSLIESTPFIEQGIMVALEESLEIVGLILLLYAITSYTEVNYRSKIQKSINLLSSKTSN